MHNSTAIHVSAVVRVRLGGLWVVGMGFVVCGGGVWVVGLMWVDVVWGDVCGLWVWARCLLTKTRRCAVGVGGCANVRDDSSLLLKVRCGCGVRGARYRRPVRLCARPCPTAWGAVTG